MVKVKGNIRVYRELWAIRLAKIRALYSLKRELNAIDRKIYLIKKGGR